MTNQRRRHIVRVLAAAVALCMFGLKASNSDANVIDATHSSVMRTHCLARFLIDLPYDFEPVGDVELIYGLTKDFRKIKVEAVPSTGAIASFEAVTSSRAADLASQYHSEAASKSMLVFNRRVAKDTVLIRSYEASNMLEYFHSELYARKDASVVKITAKTYLRDTPEAIEASVLSVAEKTTYVADPMTAGRGACLGPLLIDAGQDGEWFSVSYKSKRMPGVIIEFHSNSLLAESDGGLLSRRGSKQSLLDKIGLRSDVIRRGKIVIAGRPGEEILEKGKEHDKVRRLMTAEALLKKPATFTEPSFAISMTMGGQLPSGEYVDASLSEHDAAAMWDAIVKSIRVRPGAI